MGEGQKPKTESCWEATAKLCARDSGGTQAERKGGANSSPQELTRCIDSGLAIVTWPRSFPAAPKFSSGPQNDVQMPLPPRDLHIDAL